VVGEVIADLFEGFVDCLFLVLSDFLGLLIDEVWIWGETWLASDSEGVGCGSKRGKGGRERHTYK
jgi:hypothetical protein